MAAVNAVGRATGLEPLEQLDDLRARELYERHARRVLAYCRSRLRRHEDAEDAVQTTFLHAVSNLRRGDRPAHELAWLLGIARNVCLARIETAGRRGRLELVCDPVDLERSEAPSGRRDELIGLEAALARLPETQRRAVLLRDWRGLSYEEVAAELGVSLANAETLIFRGRRSLAAMLQEAPAETKRRLAALGHLGSLLTWAKTSLGGALGAKAAAAAAVVAVSGAGLAAGTGAFSEERAQAPRGGSTPADVRPVLAPPTPAVVTPPAGAAAPASPARPTREQTPPAAPTRRAAAPTTAGTSPAPSAPAAPDAAAPSPAAAEPAAPRPVVPGAAVPSAPAPKEAVKTATTTVAATVEGAVPALAPVAEAVVGIVESLPVPALPVETPPVVERVVEVVPTVTVTPPPALPIGPVELDPRKLLP